jgi:hypothetical protein
VFFITQFFTSLLWSSIADRHGRRAVIVASLAVSSQALYIGLSANKAGKRYCSDYVWNFGKRELDLPRSWTIADVKLPEAICIRLVQGIFGGAVGVFRGSIRDVTGESHETLADVVLIYRRDKCDKGICHVGFLMGVRRSYRTCMSRHLMELISDPRWCIRESGQELPWHLPQ